MKNLDLRDLGLKTVMLGLGLCLIGSAAVSTFPNLLLPLDQYLGTHSSVAAAALGVGVSVAAFRPVANVTWIRIAIIYSILDVSYELVMRLWAGTPFAVIPLTVSIVSAVLLILLYPQRHTLMPPRHETFGAHTTIEATL